MNPAIAKHPAVILGNWIRSSRQTARITVKEFAEMLDLKIAELIELEMGVSRWVNSKITTKICNAFDLGVHGKIEFFGMVSKAVRAKNLGFADLFPREAAKPRYKLLDRAGEEK